RVTPYSCHPISTPFPYTTLFRSILRIRQQAAIDNAIADLQGAICFDHDIAVERTRQQQCTSGNRRFACKGAAVTREGQNARTGRSEEHTSELQSRENLVCRLLLE